MDNHNDARAPPGLLSSGLPRIQRIRVVDDEASQGLVSKYNRRYQAHSFDSAFPPLYTLPPSDNTNNPVYAAKPAGEKKRKRRPDVGRGGTVEGKDESSDLERPLKAVKPGGTDDGKKKHTKKSNNPKNKKSGC
jgi:hypothetical protein